MSFMMEEILKTIASQYHNANTQEKEWLRLIEAHITEGCAEGKYQGEESTVQSGFDRGYILGFGMSYPVSVLKGLLVVNQIKQKDSNPDSAVLFKETKQLLNAFEQKWLENGPNESADQEFQNLKEQVFQLIKECNQPRVFEELATRTKNTFVSGDKLQESSKPISTAD